MKGGGVSDMSEILSFSIDHYKILEEDNLITLIQLKPVITGSNRHKTYFSLEAIKNAEPTLYNKPVICVWNKNTANFTDHARTTKQKEMLDCVGCVPETNNSQLIEEDGKTAQYINAAIWKHYFPSVALRLHSNETTKLSMEISVEKSHKRDDGFLEIDEYKYVGFTLLGEYILEAIPNANAKIIKYSTSDYSEMLDITNKQLSQLNIKQEKEEENIVIKEAVEKFSLNSNQIREILDNALSGCKYLSGICEYHKYWVNCFDETYVYIEDNESYKTYRATYNIVDNIGTVDLDSLEEVIRGNFIPVGSEPTDYKAQFEEMSVKYDELFSKCADVETKYSTLETQNNKLVTKYSDMETKYSVIETEKNELIANYSVLETDLESLKQFKVDTEKINLETKANELYSKYESYITEEEKTDLNVKLFSVDNFDIFKEKLFAIVTPKIEAENIALKQNVTNDPDKIQFSTMPLLDGINKDENKSSFEKLKEYANS